MLSRVANSMYWLNRYIERAENVARFIDANYHMTLDIPEGASDQWQPLINTTGDHELFKKLHGEATREKAIEFLVFDRNNPNSIHSCVRAARENARSVREYISSEMWEQINTFYLMINNAAKEVSMDLPHQFFVDIMTASHTFIGITDCTMNHGEGWHFGRLGRMLERADKTSRILDVKYFILLPSVDYIGSPYDNILWGALLRSASAFEMYRKQYGRIDPKKIVEFLLLSATFPRAVHYSVVTAMISMNNITGSSRGTFSNKAEQSLGRLLSEFDFAALDDIFTQGLHEYLDGAQSRINDVGAAVQKTFFSPQVEEVATEARINE
ncbi:alpha-E domain-containing protein [Geopsychrobacter electrodiphilus]|uniref:alpha-E domain-containing protein n=1 Tax=Geopsychrobacter electrodiphilus TaxID=225196 RepID=UPI00037AC49F|nr:alpha-E domain-containing protein [Geopsychrobacter electrodiphilus]